MSANSLFERFGVDEGLVGDLAEERQHHSSAWFWRQTVVALAKTATSDVRSHQLLTLRALIVGWAMQTFADALISAKFRWFGWELRTEHWMASRLGFSILPTTVVLEVVVGSMLAGWIVARTHRRCAMPMVVAYAASVLVFELATVVLSFAMGALPSNAYQLALISGVGLTIPTCNTLGGLLGTSEVRLKPDATYTSGDVLF
jgi:hypothetical protein